MGMFFKVIPFIISLAILAVFVYLSDAPKVVSAISEANLVMIIIGIFLWIFGAVVRTMRWRCLLGATGIKAKFGALFKSLVAGIFVSNLTPGKIGEPARSIFLKEESNCPINATLPSVFFERLFDIIAMFFISFFGLAFFTSDIAFWLAAALAVYAAVFAIIIFISLSEKRTMWTLRFVYRVFRSIPKIKALKSRINGFSKGFSSSFRTYGKAALIAKIFVYSLAVWVIEGLIVYIAALSLGIGLDMLPAIMVMSVATLLSILTLLPGGLGSSEVIMTALIGSFIVTGLAGVAALVLISKALTFWLYAVVGAVLTGMIGKKLIE